MGFRRYVAPSAREALEKIRQELGSDAVILSNRRLNASRVEIIAAAPGEMRALVEQFGAAPAGAAPGGDAPTRPTRGRRAGADAVRSASAPQVPPESFQEFIRRQSSFVPQRADGLALYQAMADEPAALPVSAPVRSTPVARRAPMPRPAEPSAAAPAVFRRRPSRLDEPAPAHAPLAPAPVPDLPPVLARAPAAPVNVPPAVAPPSAPEQAAPAPAPVVPAAPAAPANDARVLAELQSLRSALSGRIDHLEAQLAPVAARARPAAAAPSGAALSVRRVALTRLIMSGFSPELARRLAETVRADLDPKAIDSWLQAAVGRQIACPETAANPVFAPGAVALVGPTGVGKTTTIAKLAARFVVRHGASALGLVTLDSYRMGAHEQLRSYGRILGVTVQSAHDAASLRELLASMHGKTQVLVDTCGMSQRDQRLAEMLDMLEQVPFGSGRIQRALLINAASHAETLDEVARAWRVASTDGAVLTKIDEAARIGGALDAMLRFRLPLLGLTNGQRVPEDWHPGNPMLLAHIALKPFGAAFNLEGAEIQALAGSGALLA